MLVVYFDTKTKSPANCSQRLQRKNTSKTVYAVRYLQTMARRLRFGTKTSSEQQSIASTKIGACNYYGWRLRWDCRCIRLGPTSASKNAKKALRKCNLVCSNPQSYDDDISFKQIRIAAHTDSAKTFDAKRHLNVFIARFWVVLVTRFLHHTNIALITSDISKVTS